jgi:hypothetical protein
VNTTRRTIEIYKDNEIYELSTEVRDRMHKAIMSKCAECK